MDLIFDKSLFYKQIPWLLKDFTLNLTLEAVCLLRLNLALPKVRL